MILCIVDISYIYYSRLELQMKISGVESSGFTLQLLLLVASILVKNSSVAASLQH